MALGKNRYRDEEPEKKKVVKKSPPVAAKKKHTIKRVAAEEVEDEEEEIEDEVEVRKLAKKGVAKKSAAAPVAKEELKLKAGETLGLVGKGEFAENFRTRCRDNGTSQTFVLGRLIGKYMKGEIKL